MSMRMVFRKREESSAIARMGAMSRASLVHGTNHNQNDTWFDVDSFLLDQAKEVLNKLIDGSIDDEIWGKIVIMERCKRVAKAYLRKTTVIIDGSEDEFDGKTLGFNHFDNPERDEHTSEIRSKIGDGVILKMDLQGNIKGMARGAAPVITQGWRSDRTNCISDRLIRQQGRLNSGEEEKSYKIFDMKKFKYCLERELHDGMPDAKSLLLKTCIRVALVKEGSEMSRTPCWFAIVNLVALDMLREKVPNIRKLVKVDSMPGMSSALSTSTLAPSGHSSSAISQEALTQIIAAAVSQVNTGRLPVTPGEIAQLASTLNMSTLNETISKSIRTNDLPKRKHYHCSSSSLDSSGDDTKKGGRRWDAQQKIHDSFYDSGIEKSREKEKKKPGRSTTACRPRLSDVMFTRSHSITSDYDSNREVFDSGSWSSTNSRGFKACSTSSSLASESEHAHSATDEERHRSSEIERLDNSRHIYEENISRSQKQDMDESIYSAANSNNEHVPVAPPHERSTTEIHIGLPNSTAQTEKASASSISQITKSDKANYDDDVDDEANHIEKSIADSTSTSSRKLSSSGNVERIREALSRRSSIEFKNENSTTQDSHQHAMTNLNGSMMLRNHEQPIYEGRSSKMESQVIYEQGMQQQHQLPRHPAAMQNSNLRNNSKNGSSVSRKPFFNELRQVLHQRSDLPMRRGANSSNGTNQKLGETINEPSNLVIGRNPELGREPHRQQQKQHQQHQQQRAMDSKPMPTAKCQSGRPLSIGNTNTCVNNSMEYSSRDGTAALYGTVSHYGQIPGRGLRRTSTNIAHYAGQQQQQQSTNQPQHPAYRYRYSAHPTTPPYQASNSSTNNQLGTPSSSGTHVTCMAQSATTAVGPSAVGASRLFNSKASTPTSSAAAAHRLTRTASLPWTGSTPYQPTHHQQHQQQQPVPPAHNSISQYPRRNI